MNLRSNWKILENLEKNKMNVLYSTHNLNNIFWMKVLQEKNIRVLKRTGQIIAHDWLMEKLNKLIFVSNIPTELC